MKVVALVSGGKDSCYAMMKCMQYGHQIVALANLLPADDSVDELDSYMYQTVGHQILVSYAKCMGIPLFRRRIQGSTRHQKLGYKVTPGDEVEDMYILLKEVKKRIPSIEGVSSGAIASDYQRLRVESVCSRLGFVSLAYLWKQDQSLLLQEMIDNGIVAIIVKVAAMGLDPAKHLGREISSMFSYLHKLKELYGINVCGEGGEYETLTLDCPLFVNARIVLDDFKTVLHSADSIAPVGVLHPLAFHLENKVDTTLKNQEIVDGLCDDKMDLVHEIQGEFLQGCEDNDESVGVGDLAEATDSVINISMGEKQHIFSFSCWLLESSASSGLQEDLLEVLTSVEKRIAAYGLSWKNVLYIHLYIANMDEFVVANETYVKFITQDKCPFGVPSRSTVELPLSEVGLGRAYMEVLVANDQSKRVLHVQSISCWAPSCIGPYSQATLHKNILYMAGQLGLDPPTMTLCSGGPLAELEKALENSEAVANCYGCSISTSVISFVIYCSVSIPSSERCKIQAKLDAVLKEMRSIQENSCKLLEAIFLYVLVPCLPKRSYVEVKPMLYAVDETEMCTERETETESTSTLDYWGFQHESWHESCTEKCIVDGKVCSLLLFITQEFAVKIFSKYLDADQKIKENASLSEGQMETLSKFCIYLFDRVLAENSFCWDDILNIRLYVPVHLCIPIQTLSLTFKKAVAELAEMGRRINIADQTFISMIPVVGAGKSATSINDVMTCELLAQRT